MVLLFCISIAEGLGRVVVFKVQAMFHRTSAMADIEHENTSFDLMMSLWCVARACTQLPPSPNTSWWVACFRAAQAALWFWEGTTGLCEIPGTAGSAIDTAIFLNYSL